MTGLRKEICIIGAGVSGLTAIKACIECGLTAQCYEMASDIGGMWNREERIKTGLIPQTYPTLVCNASKDISAFTDFPPPADWPLFLDQPRTLEYLKLYAEEKELANHIKFNTEIVKVTRADDYDVTGCWDVQIRDRKTDTIEVKRYDAVICAIGRFRKQMRPEIPGLYDKFSGELHFGGTYKSPNRFRDKKVLIIGAGFTGCDIAVDCTKVTKKVLLSSKKGVFLVQRVFKSGLPYDLVWANRFTLWLTSWFPQWLKKRWFLNPITERFSHKAFGLQSKFPFGNIRAFTLVQDEIQLKLLAGYIHVRPEVQKVDERTVKFSDGTCEEVDAIIVCAGYSSDFSIIPELGDIENAAEFRHYFEVVPFDFKHPETLTFVGNITTGNVAMFSQMEMQAMLVARTLSGQQKLPSKKEMESHWTAARRKVTRQTGGQKVLRCSFMSYSEGIARLLGWFPSFLRLLFTDPKLAFRVYFGPMVPYHYQLNHRRWPEARKHSMKTVAEMLQRCK